VLAVALDAMRIARAPTTFARFRRSERGLTAREREQRLFIGVELAGRVVPASLHFLALDAVGCADLKCGAAPAVEGFERCPPLIPSC
jgi:hypothetical protein